MSGPTTQAQTYLEKHHDQFLQELQEFLRIPSVSTDPDYQGDIVRAAEWAADRLRAMGMERVEIVPTGGHPVVFAEWLAAGSDAPTVLIYGHYDVQPPEPLEDWDSPPFEPEIRSDSLYARGATDMKGQIMASFAAVEALIQSGSPSVNLKFLIEGEEEIGSPHLDPFLIDNRQRLACDLVLNPDAGGMPDPDTPSIVYSLRGGAQFRLQVFGPRQDLHSGMFGGAIHNPIHALSALIAALHDEKGRINLPDFYRDVRPLDEEEREKIARLPFGEAYYRRVAGVSTLWGEPEYTPTERIGGRPSLNVNLFEAGQSKAAIPAKATAEISFRLVPDQDPDEVHRSLRRFLQTHAPPTVRWELKYITGFPPALTSLDSPGVRAIQAALQTNFENPPVFQRVGGSIPAVLMFQETLGVDSVLTGFSLRDDNLHGPNEKINLPAWKRGMSTLLHFFTILPEHQGE